MSDTSTSTSETPVVLAGYLSKGQLAEQLGVSDRTLDRWHTERIGPPRTVLGRTVYYQVEKVRQWVQEQEQEQPRAAVGA